MRVYLDNAATTPMHKEVIETMAQAMQELFGNPSSIHAEGRKVRASLEDARKRIAHHIGASIGEVFFTSGGTEANNMAIKCSVRDLGVKRIISTAIEHHCGLHAFESVVKHKGVELILLDIDAAGNIDLKQLENYLQADSAKTLVSLMHANNEIGTMHDLEAIGELCATYNAYFHSDTVQT
ncbi:MAG: cysteine desulfurase family protein, partial [Saprospiraceae bacterium]